MNEQKKLRSKAVIQINMPQMALKGLSENWLFKEIGSRHWSLISEGLGANSDEIKDSQGNRLYATFVRIRTESNCGLTEFQENEALHIQSDISRLGSMMYFSRSELRTKDGKELIAKLMTSFSKRSGETNKGLVKSQPNIESNIVQDLEEMPEFGYEYLLLKRQKSNELKLDEHLFTREAEILFETTYTLNPYHDLNGIGLLYFAAYPIINDFCEAIYANGEVLSEPDNRWEELYATQSRDILYFANCDINEKIIYRVHSLVIKDNRAHIHSSLYRQSDDKKMAEIFTTKVKS